MVAVNNLYSSRIQLLQQQQILRSGNLNENNVSLFSNTEGLTQGMFDGTCIDGKDDGKIGLWEGIKSFAKGAVKSVTNMFSSPKNFLKTAAVALGSAALIAVTGGAATPFLIAGGAIAGGIQAGKGIYDATQATTDAEKRQALENVGGGAATIAMSAAAGKSYTNATGNALIGKGSLSTYQNAFSASKTNAAANFGNLTASAKNAAQNLSGSIKNAKANFQATADAFKGRFNSNPDIIDTTFVDLGSAEPMTTELSLFNSKTSSTSQTINFGSAADTIQTASFKGYRNGVEYFS